MTAGFEYEVGGDLVLGTRGVYRAMINVIEDGSFDDGDTYFIFNPGRIGLGTTEEAACAGDPAVGVRLSALAAPNVFTAGSSSRRISGLRITSSSSLLTCTRLDR